LEYLCGGSTSDKRIGSRDTPLFLVIHAQRYFHPLVNIQSAPAKCVLVAYEALFFFVSFSGCSEIYLNPQGFNE